MIEKRDQKKQTIVSGAIIGIVCLLTLLSFALPASAVCQRDLSQTLAELNRTLPTQTVTVSTTDEFLSALSDANSGGGNRTILLEDGEYSIQGLLNVTANHVTVRSVSGNRDSVRIVGQGMFGNFQNLFNVTGDYFTLADLSVGNVRNHAVQIHGENDADFALIHNVRFFDTGEQMLKVSFDSNNTQHGSDWGVVEWSTFEYTAGVGPRFYIGGVDAHNASDWIVRNNQFKNIRSPEAALAEHAVHFWSNSKNTLTEKNIIVNCDRGIGYGMASYGHQGGTIRNNMVHTGRDVGIILESSRETAVYNNTVYTPSYTNSIEFRFSGTHGGTIINNLTNKPITSRDGGSATLSSNFTEAEASWFIDPENADLHLVEPIDVIVDRGDTLSELIQDIDCDVRLQGSYDIGADELENAPVDEDTDGDTVPDAVDNCPDVPNQDQADLDGNGVGDACEQSVGDVNIVKEQFLAVDRGIDSESSLPVVHRGDVISYRISVTNLLHQAVTFMISDAVSAYVDYVASSLMIQEAGIGVMPSDDLADGQLEYNSGLLDYGETLLITFDVNVADVLPDSASIIENTAKVEVAYAGGLLNKSSNSVMVQIADITPEPVPEPSTFIFLGIGLLGIAALRKK